MFQQKYIQTVQGDTSGCEEPPVDIKTTAWPSQNRTFVLMSTGGLVQPDVSLCTSNFKYQTKGKWPDGYAGMRNLSFVVLISHFPVILYTSYPLPAIWCSKTRGDGFCNMFSESVRVP